MMSSGHGSAFRITGTVYSPRKGHMMRTLDIFFRANLNKLLNKQSICRCFETPCHCAHVKSLQVSVFATCSWGCTTWYLKCRVLFSHSSYIYTNVWIINWVTWSGLSDPENCGRGIMTDIIAVSRCKAIFHVSSFCFIDLLFRHTTKIVSLGQIR